MAASRLIQKDLKGKKIVLGRRAETDWDWLLCSHDKGEAEAATELTKNGLPTEVTTDAPTEAAIQKQIEYIDNDVSRGMDGILFAANESDRNFAGASQSFESRSSRYRI